MSRAKAGVMEKHSPPPANYRTEDGTASLSISLLSRSRGLAKPPYELTGHLPVFPTFNLCFTLVNPFIVAKIVWSVPRHQLLAQGLMCVSETSEMAGWRHELRNKQAG